jgi:hypothetical protein
VLQKVSGGDSVSHLWNRDKSTVSKRLTKPLVYSVHIRMKVCHRKYQIFCKSITSRHLHFISSERVDITLVCQLMYVCMCVCAGYPDNSHNADQ